MSRLSTVCLVLSAAYTASAAPTEPDAPDPRPNVIVVITDDQSPMPWAPEGYRSARPFGYCGADDVYTPNIDQLAADGVVFNRAYVSSSVCSPSRYSSLTGRYASRCEGPVFQRLHPPGTVARVENNTELELDRPNIAGLLSAVGYETGFVGKCHLIDHDVLNQPRKWAEYGLATYAHDADPRDPVVNSKLKQNHNWWRDRVTRYGFHWAGSVYSGNLKVLYNDALNVHNVDWTTDAALSFLDRPRDKPFFLYYATTTPHGPDPWNRKDGAYWSSVDADAGMTGEGYRTDLAESSQEQRDAAKRAVAARNKACDEAWLTWLDASIGRLRDRLETAGELANTVFVITSDHGGWRHGKTTLYEGGVRVPLLVHWPAGAATGATYSGLVQNVDLAPTLLDLAGVPESEWPAMDGVSLQSAIRGDSSTCHDNLFLELGYAHGVVTDGWKYIAVRYDQAMEAQIDRGEPFKGWQGAAIERPYLLRNAHLGHLAAKYNSNYFLPEQLYDLRSDPREETNLIESNPEQAAQMRERLRRHLETLPDRPFGEFTQSGDTVQATTHAQREPATRTSSRPATAEASADAPRYPSP